MGLQNTQLKLIEFYNELTIEAINKAVDENQNENFTESSDLLILVYNLDKEKNTEYLYYASSMELQADNYERALIYLNQKI